MNEDNQITVNGKILAKGDWVIFVIIALLVAIFFAGAAVGSAF